jgi:hypothetical protein
MMEPLPHSYHRNLCAEAIASPIRASPVRYSCWPVSPWPPPSQAIPSLAKSIGPLPMTDTTRTCRRFGCRRRFTLNHRRGRCSNRSRPGREPLSRRAALLLRHLPQARLEITTAALGRLRLTRLQTGLEGLHGRENGCPVLPNAQSSPRHEPP